MELMKELKGNFKLDGRGVENKSVDRMRDGTAKIRIIAEAGRKADFAEQIKKVHGVAEIKELSKKKTICIRDIASHIEEEEVREKRAREVEGWGEERVKIRMSREQRS